MTNTWKQNAHGRGIGKAQSGKCRAGACAQKGHAQQVGKIVRASKKAHAHTKGVVDVGVWLRLWRCRLCVEHACTVPRAKNAQGDCVWITRGVAFQHRLAAYSSSTIQVFGAGHTGRLCCSSQQASLPVAVCALVVGGGVVGVHASQ